ncbi:MAG TPA: hypothetical protein VFB49_05175 [Patescibacteria group bacterium]|nr:hypothetical protein [Patescibacteria group bacterium]
MRSLRLIAAGLAGLLAIGSAALFAAPLPVVGAPQVTVNTSPVSVGVDQYVPAGTVHEGDLVTVMGKARVDGEVTGEIVVVLGDLEMSGTAHGEVVAVMSSVHLTETARVEGQMVSVGWAPALDAGSRVEGESVNIAFMNLLPFMGHGGGLSGLIRLFLILKLISLAFLFVILLLISALVPRRVANIAAAFPTRWGSALGVGVLAYAVLIVGSLLLIVTLIGIPVAMLLIFIGAVTKWLGLAGLLYLIGRTLGRNVLSRELPHLAAVLAGFIVFAVLRLVPILGLAFGLVVSVLAMGAALVTRFGAEPAARAVPPASPAVDPTAATGPASGAAPGIASNAPPINS